MTTDLRGLLREAREEIYARVPDKLTQVPDGEIFSPGPMGLSSSVGGTPKVGESAGYRTIVNVTGNWASGPGPWRVQHMLWADNPDYARTWDLINRIDAALAEKAPEPVASRRIRAWIRGHMSSYGAVSPPEYDEECVPGEDEPEGKGWIPLYAAPPPASPSDARVDWSWIRSVLAQGASIRQDYQAGKYPTYEHYAARLDEAARERMAAIEREGGANG